MPKKTNSKRFTRFSICTALILGLSACGTNENAQQLALAKRSIPTVGERVHETLLEAQKDQPCEAEKQKLLINRKSEVVGHIDRLVNDFPIGAPDEVLLNQRLNWLLENDIEPEFDHLARLFAEQSTHFGKNLDLLIPELSISFPTEETLLSMLLFAQREELKIVEQRIRQGVSEETHAILERLGELALSERGTYVYETLLNPQALSWPNEDDIVWFLQFTQNKEVQILGKALFYAVPEILDPSSNLRDLVEHANLITSALKLTPHFSMPTNEEAAKYLRLINSKDFEYLLDGLFYKRAPERVSFILKQLQPFHEFSKLSAGRDFLHYLKRFITDSKARKFFLDFADFAKSQRGWFDQSFLSLCLGESWTSLRPGQNLCIQRMKWAGLDGDLSRELLEHGSILYQMGLTDLGLDIETQLKQLLVDLEDETGLAKNLLAQMDISFPSSGTEIYDFFENDKNRETYLHFFESVFELGLDDKIIHLATLASRMCIEHELEIQAIKTLFDKGLLSTKKIRQEQVDTILEFLSSRSNQEAFKIIFDSLRQESVRHDLLRLWKNAESVRTDEAKTIAALTNLSLELGFSIQIPDRKTIRSFLAFANDKNKMKAVKEIGTSLPDLLVGISQLRSSFATFPGGSGNHLSEASRDGFFSLLDRITKEDVTAFSGLTEIAFDLWSLSEQNQCRLPIKREFGPLNFEHTFSKWGDFFASKTYGPKPMLSLMRRIAQDMQSN